MVKGLVPMIVRAYLALDWQEAALYALVCFASGLFRALDGDPRWFFCAALTAVFAMRIRRPS